MPLICLMCLLAFAGPEQDTASPLRPLRRTQFYCPAALNHRLSIDLSLEPGLPGLWSNERCQLKFDGPQQLRPTQKSLAEMTGIAAGTAPNPTPWREPTGGSGGSFHPSFSPPAKVH